MSNRLRNVAALVLLFVLPGCMSMPMEGGQAHPDLDVELMLQILSDIDYVITNYGWLAALLGL